MEFSKGTYDTRLYVWYFTHKPTPSFGLGILLEVLGVKGHMHIRG